MAVGFQLFEIVNSYLRGSVDLHALDMWLAQHAEELAHLDDNDPMAQLSGLIEVTLAEMDDGVAAKAELDSKIATFLVGYVEELKISSDALTETAEPLGAEVVVSSTTGSLPIGEGIPA